MNREASKEPLEPLEPLTVISDIVSAADEAECRAAARKLEQLLVTEPMKSVPKYTGWMNTFIYEHLMETVQTHFEGVKAPDRRLILLDDLQNLLVPLLPGMLLSPESLHLNQTITQVSSVEDYLSHRDEIQKAVQTLPDWERESVSGILAQKLESLLIAAALPELVQDPQSLDARRFALWQDLQAGNQRGVGSPVLYFLVVEDGALRILLPGVLEQNPTAAQFYDAARIAAVLSSQLVPEKRDSMMRVLHDLTEKEALRRAEQDLQDSDTHAIQELFILLQSAMKLEHPAFWDMPLFQQNYHALKFGGRKPGQGEEI